MYDFREQHIIIAVFVFEKLIEFLLYLLIKVYSQNLSLKLTKLITLLRHCTEKTFSCQSLNSSLKHFDQYLLYLLKKFKFLWWYVFELLKNDTHSPVPQKILLKFGIRMYYHKLHLRWVLYMNMYDIAEYFWKFNDHKLKTVLYHLEIGITMYWDFDLKSLIMNFLSFFSFKHL